MKYATWIIKRPEGTTPDSIIKESESWADGAIMLKDDLVLGYLSDDLKIEDFSSWDIKLVSKQKFLELAKTKNSGCYFLENGTIGAPLKDER